MALGHFPGEPPDDPFNMAVMGLRLAGRSNGVADPARPDQPGHVPGAVAARPVEEVPDQLDDQRRARPDLGLLGDERPVLQVRVAGLG